ncbi:hypothetical protein BCR36DRAFT_581659 [Piromyces finnis]|uniref:PH domain-containing protein n=1 Tax=Piromyces finnis TaxID=1754191 RepID=A0A1Y1VH40_9FUNG|nr:hypothetical protein BCR36DRAFT_581659 [Piromyces finnis]|eukprot:ORX54770.1 hypothetical protein BCR36DRAFT_581659 [Piromyces finnis]
MSNPTPPTILRNLYAKLETMEKELNENSSSMVQKPDNIKPPMSPLSLPSNGNPSDIKKQYNIVDKMSKLSMNDPHNAASPQIAYQDSEFPKYSSSVRSDSLGQRVRGSYGDKDNEYNSPKINSIRVAPTPPSINTYYNQQNSRYAPKSEDDTFNVESPYETDMPRYSSNSYGNSYPQSTQIPYDRMRSPSSSYAFSPDSATFYNESFQNNDASIPKIDEYGNYLSDYKHDSGREFFIPQRQSDYSGVNMTKSSISNSFDLNADLEAHQARSFITDSVSESMSDSKSFLAAAAEIDMNFDPSILSGKGKKIMRDLVNSNNFHKGGNLTICTNILFNKKKTLFYALTTHRLYVFKEDRSEAELITHYTIDKNTKCTKAGIYAGVRNFELSTVKNNEKQREVFEFECSSKEEKDEWLHSINKVIQLHKYRDKTLPPAPNGVTIPNSNEPYTTTLKTQNMKFGVPTPSLSPEISPSFYSNANTSMGGNSYKSPSLHTSQYSGKYEPSISSQASGNYQKIPSMYVGATKNSPQPALMNSPPLNGNRRQPSPNINPTNTQMGSPNFNYMNRNPKNLPINQLISNTPPIQNRNTPPSPRVNYYQRSPMQRPQN